jgi:8-oxo-dGTP pyrophosphatase MutT (NUDIX family)
MVLKVSYYFNANFSEYCPKRAGVVLYYKDKKTKEVLIGLGVSNFNLGLTDFGGTVDDYEKPTDAAIRELNEESLFVFKKLKYEELKKLKVFYDKKSLLIFLEVNSEPQEISKAFNEKLNSLEDFVIPEITEIVWFPLKKIKKMLDEEKELFYQKFYSIFKKSLDRVRW